MDGVSNHQPHHCLLNRLFGYSSKKTPKLRVTGLCAGNSPGTGDFPTQMVSNAENVSVWWRHHVLVLLFTTLWCSLSSFYKFWRSLHCDWLHSYQRVFMMYVLSSLVMAGVIVVHQVPVNSRTSRKYTGITYIYVLSVNLVILCQQK